MTRTERLVGGVAHPASRQVVPRHDLRVNGRIVDIASRRSAISAVEEPLLREPSKVIPCATSSKGSHDDPAESHPLCLDPLEIAKSGRPVRLVQIHQLQLGLDFTKPLC